MPCHAVSCHAVLCCALRPPNRQGFSGQLFPLYYDSRTWNPYKKADQVAIEFDGLNSSSPSSIYIAFPAMRKLAQDHFGCPSLPGAPADVGSFASHFKQRLMGVSECVNTLVAVEGQHVCCILGGYNTNAGVYKCKSGESVCGGRASSGRLLQTTDIWLAAEQLLLDEACCVACAAR